MTIDLIKLKWDGFRDRLFGMSDKRRNGQSLKVNSVRERSIAILQKRYGYTREQATSELDKHYPHAWLG